MSESTPPVPKSGGSGPFILAAIVMLLLMGGLIYWKMQSSGGETAKVEAPKPTVAPEQPALDEPPPPPPPPVASADSSAKPDDTKPGTKKVGSATPMACGECTGEPNPGLSAALNGKAGQSRGCYEKALSTNSTLSGHMTVAIKINQSGAVCSASVKSDMNNAGVENCVLQNFRATTFPAPKGGCVEAHVPLNFKPKT